MLSQGLVCYYRQSFFQVYPLFFVTLAGFGLIHLIDARSFLKGVLLVDEFLGGGLPTLWFATLILWFYLLVPVYLNGYSLGRSFAVTVALLGILGLMKLAGHLVDIRVFQFLLLFLAAMIASRQHNLIVKVQRGVRLVIFGLLLPVWVAASVFSASSPLLSGTCSGLAMLASIPLFLRIGASAATVAASAPFEFLCRIWFPAFLLHRLAYGMTLDLFAPVSRASSLLCLILVGLPLTLLSAHFCQNACNWFVRRLGGAEGVAGGRSLT